MACERCVFGTGSHNCNDEVERLTLQTDGQIMYATKYISPATCERCVFGSGRHRKDCAVGIIEKDLEKAIEEFRADLNGSSFSFPREWL